MNDALKKYFKRLRSPKALVALGICGIALIFLSSLGGKGEKAVQSSPTEEFSAELYRKELEQELEDLVKSITGGGRVSVVVTLDSTMKYSYADIHEESVSSQSGKETNSNDSQLKEGYITVKTSDGGEQALLVTTQMRSVRGVAIVCDGGDSEALSNKIEGAVTSALNITSKRVYVCGRNN